MLKYCLKKIGQLAIVMLLISFFSFAIIDLAPGDISSMYLTPDMTETERQLITEKLGLDKSMPEQYWGWLTEALQGNFGVSLSYNTPVAPMLLRRLPSTILLMGVSLLVSLALAIPLGLIAGYKKNTWADNLISSFAYFGMSIPSFYFGMLMIILFTATLHWLPSSGMHSVGVDTPLDTLQHMIMPVLTMALGTMASKIRYVRANTIGQLSEEYVLASKAKGCTPAQILRKHVLKNTLLPIITILGMNMASLVCGSFIIESVFGWPGVGSFHRQARLSGHHGLHHALRLHFGRRQFRGGHPVFLCRSANQEGD